MNYAEIKHHIWRNSVSNYVRTLLGMVVGLITFRLLYQALDREEFGFWSLLWSLFGYGSLLDLGFGFAAQKQVVELSIKQDWDKLGRVLSTILVFYAAMAAVIALAVVLGAAAVVGWLGISAAKSDEFRRVLVWFFAGLCFAFPLGVFPEILRGQQRIRLANQLVSAALVLRLAFIAAAVWLHWSLTALTIIALVFALVPDALAGVLALRSMPAVRLSPRRFSPALIRETMRFSLYAYLGSTTNLLLGKTDQLVLGATLSVASVGLYQAGGRVAEVFHQFTRQVQETLSPAAAHLHALGERAALGDLLVNSLRWSVVIATPLYLLCAFHLPELLRLLTGERVAPPETCLVGHVLLAWFYTTILTHSVSKRIFMMCGHERRLMWLGLAEAVANLLLSIALVLVFRNVAAVAVGSLLPTLFFGWVFLWPWMAREAGLTAGELFRRAILPAWIACVPMLVFLLAAHVGAVFPADNPWLPVLLQGSAAGLIAAFTLWRVALNPRERDELSRRLPLRLPNLLPA